MLRNTRILFINPSLSQYDRYSSLSGVGSYIEPLSLCYLAAYTRSQGITTDILDASPLGLDNESLVRKAIQMNPDFVGFTASTLSIRRAALLANKIKIANKSIKTLIGGHHLTSLPENTIAQFSGFDIGIIGEGELTVIDLLTNFTMGKNLEDINGVVFRRDGHIHVTAPRKLIDNLDVLPIPAWDLLRAFEHKFRYRPSLISLNRLPSLSVMFSRGCLGTCKFCSNVIFGKSYRTHSPHYFIEIMKYLKRRGIIDLSFQDSCFGWNRERTLLLCELMIKNNLKYSWNCQSRADILNEQLIRLMKKAGCWQIKFGIESLSPALLRNLNKDIAIGDINKAITLCKRYQIKTVGYFLIGNPGETYKDIRNMIYFATTSGLDDFKLNYLTPYPGSMFYSQAERYGVFYNDWSKMNEREIAFIPYSLTKKQLKTLYMEAYIKFYSRPIIIRSHLRWINTAQKVFIALLAFCSVILTFLTRRLKSHREGRYRITNVKNRL